MTRFKFRAECTIDIIQFIIAAKDAGIDIHNPNHRIMNIDGTPLPDAEFQFDTKTGTLDKIIDVMKGMEDAHVMYQTVQPIDTYTGERDFDIE